MMMLNRYVWLATHAETSERHKLDYVPCSGFPTGRKQRFVIAVKELHFAEVCASDTHYDDGHGQARSLDDCRARQIHVCDHAVRNDEQHKVLLQVKKRENVE